MNAVVIGFPREGYAPSLGEWTTREKLALLGSHEEKNLPEGRQYGDLEKR